MVCISVQRKFRDGKVVATGNDACILDPLQAARKPGSGSAFFHNGILKFFVFLAQLLGDRLKAFPDNGLILSVGVFYHVIFIRAHNITLNLQNLVHALCIYKSLHGIRHTAYNGILQ